MRVPEPPSEGSLTSWERVKSVIKSPCCYESQARDSSLRMRSPGPVPMFILMFILVVRITVRSPQRKHLHYTRRPSAASLPAHIDADTSTPLPPRGGAAAAALPAAPAAAISAAETRRREVPGRLGGGRVACRTGARELLACWRHASRRARARGGVKRIGAWSQP